MIRNAVIRLALIDDHALFRDGFKHALEANRTMRVVAEAGTLKEALQFCSQGPECDLALVDYELTRGIEPGDGLHVLRALRSSRPAVRVVIVTGGMSREAIAEASCAMQASVFLKAEPIAELFVLIERTMRGEVVLSPAAHGVVDATANTHPGELILFSPRERLVLRWITEGFANKEIADRVEISEPNVKAIIQRLFHKTGVRSRSQLVRYVFEFNVELT